MASFFERVRSRLATGRGRAESGPIEVEVASFVGFLRQQARWIAEHTAYEKDLSHSLSSASQVLVRFDIHTYAGNIDRYLSQRNLYARKVEELSRIAFTILAPPADIAQLLSNEHRKQLFAETLVSISLSCDVSLAQLIKTYYSVAAGLSAPFNGCSRDDLLDLYKQAVEIADKNARTRVERRSPAELFDTGALFTDVLGGLGVRQRSDLTRLFERTSLITLVGSLILEAMAGAVFVYLAGRPDFQELVWPSASPEARPRLQLLLTVCSAGLVMVLALAGILRYAQDRLRRSHVVRTLRTLTRHLSLAHNVLEEYFKGRFDFPIKHLK